MKRTTHALALVGCGFLGWMAMPGAAQGQGFYLNADLGPSLAEDVSISRFIVPTPGTKFELDPGIRLGVAGGYNFNEYVGLQLETGLIHNEVKDVNHGGSIDASLGHVPMLADVVFRYDRPNCRWIPYIGAGAGGDVSVIDLDQVWAPNGSIVDGSGSSFVFAWQVFGGVRYRFNDHMSIGGGYRFFYADGASWDVSNSSGDIRSDTARVHSFGVDFNMTF